MLTFWIIRVNYIWFCCKCALFWQVGLNYKNQISKILILYYKYSIFFFFFFFWEGFPYRFYSLPVSCDYMVISVPLSLSLSGVEVKSSTLLSRGPFRSSFGAFFYCCSLSSPYRVCIVTDLQLFNLWAFFLRLSTLRLLSTLILRLRHTVKFLLDWVQI